MEQLRAAWTKIVKDVHAQDALFANVLVPLSHAENIFARESHMLTFYSSVSEDPDARSASNQVRTLFDDLVVEGASNDSLFRLIDAAARRNESLGPEDARYLAIKRRQYVRNGMLLPASQDRERLREIKRQISEQSASFHSNLANCGACIWFTRHELDGVPERVLSTLEVGEGENEDRLKVTFKTSHLAAVMRYARRTEVRKKMFIGNENRCAENIALFRNVVILRDEAARLLGYSSHATMKLEDRMAKTPEAVNTFLQDLRTRLQSLSLEESAKLRELKASNSTVAECVGRDRLFLWDQPFYNRLSAEMRHSVDQEKLSEYFPVDVVVDRMLDIFQELFGLRFTDITNSPSQHTDSFLNQNAPASWHEDVRIFCTTDDDLQQTLIGYLYMDLFSRDGKVGGPCNFNLVPASCMLLVHSIPS